MIGFDKSLKLLTKPFGGSVHIQRFTTARVMQLDIDTRYTLPTGYRIPAIGFGVYQTPADVAEDVVDHAFKIGYRHIDSARVYRNEQPCADAIRKSGISRNDIFFTSKVPPRSMGYEATKASIESSFKQTGLDYIDLYLIHAPYGGRAARKGSWLALLEAQRTGRIRSLGVSNYGVHHLDELEAYIAEIDAKEGGGRGGQISVGQWEIHPWLMRPDIVEWCKQRGVICEAYCPLVRGQRFEEKALLQLADKHKKTPAQILIRWSLQKGHVPLPKSITPSRIAENADIYNFELSADDLRVLETDDYAPCSWDPTTHRD